MFTYCGVVFFEELNDSKIVLECHDVRLGKDVKFRHVRSRGRQGTQDVFGETNGV